MAFEDILKQIESDAAEEAEAVRADATARIAEIEATAQRESDALKTQLTSRASQRATEHGDRLTSLAQLDHRKAVLAEKQAGLAEAFRQAEERISSLPDDTLKSFFSRVISERAETGHEEIIPGRAHAALFDQQFLSQINAAIGNNAQLKLGSASSDFEHGVILREGRKDINLRMSVLMQEAREQLVNSVAGILFPSDPSNG